MASSPYISVTSRGSHLGVTALVSIIILSVPLVFLDTTGQMIDVWITNETFTHGFLIYPLALWLIWRSRARISKCTITTEIRPMLLLIMVLAVWILGDIVDVQVIKQLAMISMTPVLVWILLGREVLLSVLFSLCYLFFAVPAGQSLIPPMMDLTADFTVAMIRLSGIPVFREGFFFSLPSGDWSVVEECSGVRYLIASLALGTLFAYLSYSSIWKRLVFVVVSGLVPVLANGVRAYGIVMLGHISDMKIAVGADHLLYGWVFFGLIIFALFFIGSRWSDPRSTDLAENGPERKVMAQISWQKLLPAGCCVVLSLFAAKGLAGYLVDVPASEARLAPPALPENLEAWQQLEGVNIGWSPIFEGPDLTMEKTYRFGGDIVQVNIGHYHYQRQGAEVASTLNRITNPYSGNWVLTRRVDLNVDKFYVTESEARHDDGSVLVWHWYQLGDLNTPNIYIAKVFEAYNKIFTGRLDGSMITLSTRLHDLDADRENLKEVAGIFIQTQLSKSK